MESDKPALSAPQRRPRPVRGLWVSTTVATEARSAPSPRAVIVEDMQVADSDSEEDEVCDTRIVRVVANGSAAQGPSWHALLRRTSRTRTQLSTTSRIIRTSTPQRPPVHVPAKVLAPRVLPLLPRQAVSITVGPAGDFKCPVTVASPFEPLTGAESAILDGVLDLIDEQRTSDVRAWMEQYGVSSADSLPQFWTEGSASG